MSSPEDIIDVTAVTQESPTQVDNGQPEPYSNTIQHLEPEADTPEEEWAEEVATGEDWAILGQKRLLQVARVAKLKQSEPGERVWAVTLPPSVKLGTCGQCGQVCEVGNGAYWAALRRVMGVTQREVARAGRLSVQMVNGVETGKKKVTGRVERAYQRVWGQWVAQRGGVGYGKEAPEVVTPRRVKGRPQVRTFARKVQETLDAIAAQERRPIKELTDEECVPTVVVGRGFAN